MISKICNAKRIIVARFDEGEDLLKSLVKCADEYKIKAAWFCVIGGLKEFAFGLYKKGGYHIIVKKAVNCFELLPTFGNISIKDGKINIHAHVIASDEKQGRVFGGHLFEGSKIFPFVEVVIHEYDLTLTRNYDRKTNLWPLQLS